MEAALKTLRMIWGALLLAVLVYIRLSFVAKVTQSPDPVLVRVISILAFCEIPVLFFVRMQLFKGAAGVLQTSPNDALALARWRSASILSWALSLSIALFGLVLRYMGLQFRQALVFFAAGVFLMLLLAPRRPS